MKRKFLSRYYADDKDILDLLLTSSARRQKDQLLKLARARGIFLSRDDDAGYLAGYISKLQFGWAQLRQLNDVTESGREKRESVTSTVVKHRGDLAAVAAAVEAVAANRMAGHNEVCRSVVENGRVVLVVQYLDYERARNRLSQGQEKDVKIVCELVGENLTVRRTAAGRAGEIGDEILAALKPPEEDRLVYDLSKIADAGERTSFFLLILKGLAGLKLLNVRKVNCERLNISPAVAPAEDESQEEQEADREHMTATVNTLLLKGTQLLESSEFKDVSQKGYFISHLEWEAERTAAPDKGQVVAFEAGFKSDDGTRDFAYSCLGVRRLRADSTKAVKARERLPSMDAEGYTRLLEGAATEAYRQVAKKNSVPLATMVAGASGGGA